jgi:hypothetical protein
MYSESRKIHLVQEVLKTESEAVLVEIESVLKKAKRASARDFLGAFTTKDAAVIDAAIEDGCEQINTDDWK